MVPVGYNARLPKFGEVIVPYDPRIVPPHLAANVLSSYLVYFSINFILPIDTTALNPFLGSSTFVKK